MRPGLVASALLLVCVVLPRLAVAERNPALVGRWGLDDPVLSGRVDLGKVGAMGWSLGGDAALEWARTDPRVQAVIAFDVGDMVLAGLQTTPFPQPVLFVQAEQNADRRLFDAVDGPAVVLQIRGTVHDSFSAYYWDLAPAVPDRGREAARTVVGFSRWFADRYLRGENAPIPTTADYPRAFGFRQK